MSVPNQRTVQTGQKEPCDKQHNYTVNNLEVMQEAMNALTGNEFKLWMYFAKNQAGYKVECSPVAIAQWGIKRSTYKDAFNKLVELGYLEEKSKSYYIFHERAKPAEVITVEIAEKEEPCAFQF